MKQTTIKAGDIVRHRHLMTITNLSVVEVFGQKVVVRYVSDGLFRTQELYAHEVEVFTEDKDEYK